MKRTIQCSHAKPISSCDECYPIFLEETSTTQSDNTLDELRVKLVVYMSFYVEARDQKDPIEMSKWIDKIEELFPENISSLASAIKALELPDYDDADPYQQGYMWAIGQATSAIQAERAKLKEVK